MAGKLSSGPGTGKVQATEQNSDINVTPFVDVMLVLLIIFMVSAPLATVSIRLDLPPATPPVAGEEPPEPVFISVQESGELFIEEEATTLDTLIADVCVALGGGACQEERVFVRAQPEVPYERFMEVMNTLQGSGFYKIGLLNEDIE